jgi:hypothetical protein
MYNLSRLDPLYQLEVCRFIDATRRHVCRQKTKHVYCPYIDCTNVFVFEDVEQIISHLVRQGCMEDYLIWAKHGEGSSMPYAIGNPADIDD